MLSIHFWEGTYAAFESLPKSKIQATSSKTSIALLITGLSRCRRVGRTCHCIKGTCVN